MRSIPFSLDELRPAGYFEPLGGGRAPVFSTPATPKEKILAALRGEAPLWLPMTSDCKKFVPRVIPDNLPRGLLLESRPFSRERFTGGKDMFGVNWVWDARAGGSMVVPGAPLICEACELDCKLLWPDPGTWDWAGSSRENAGYIQTDFLLGTTIFTGFFERLISLMDFQNAAIALIDEDDQPYIHRFFDRLCTLYEEMIPRYRRYFGVDLIELHDDWGSQRAPFFSLDTVREMIVPYLRRVVDCAHANGMVFELHSCGCNAALTPAMIEAGVDAWAPQRTANDTQAIYETYGARITIGVSCPLSPDAPERQYIEWAGQFVESCVGRAGLRTPYLFDLRTPPCFREAVYRLSRQKLFG